MTIGIIGHIGAGKSTVAQILTVQHGFTRYKFAGKLKAMLAVLGLTERELEGDLKEAPCALLGGMTPRGAMRTLGTEWGRYLIDEDMWVRFAMVELDRCTKMSPVVFDDVRFPNEAHSIKDRGGVIWHVMRDNKGATKHASECGLHKIIPDEIIMNNGTLEELAEEVDRHI